MSIGALAGLLLGSLVYHRLAFLAADSAGRKIILALLIIALGCVCYDLCLTFGKILERRFRPHSIKGTLKRFISGGTAAITSILVVWLTLGVSSAINNEAIQRQLTSSRVAAALQNHTNLPNVFQDAANLLSPFNSPKTFIGSEPTFNDTVAVSQSFTELDDAVKSSANAVYKISSWGCGSTTIGSGFLISDKAIVTNAHVIAGASRISVQDKATATNYTAQPIWFDPSLDLAVLSVTTPLAQKPLTFHSGTVNAGDIGSVLGYPGGGSFIDADAIILQSLNAKGYDIYNKETITRTIFVLRGTVVPGNSGGPLIDTSGKVLGLVFGHSTSQNHTGYALTATQIEPSVAAALKQNAVVSSGPCEM